MIDLHAHTTASDGTYTPVELVRSAAEIGITHLAITDHDSIAGLGPAAGAADRARIRLTPAVELSARYDGQPMDILGYGINPDDGGLRRAIQTMIDRRNERTPQIVERLREAGLAVTLEDVIQGVGGEVIGRPHVARALVNLGIVSSVQEAFDRIWRGGTWDTCLKEVFTPGQAIDVIKDAGGVAVLAHPMYLKLDQDEFDSMLDSLVEQGLAGLEVHYSQHTRNDVERFAAAARSRGLLETGGSDFHGENKPHITLGMGPEGGLVPERLAFQLLERLEQST